jgi:hypothetical protein
MLTSNGRHSRNSVDRQQDPQAVAAVTADGSQGREEGAGSGSASVAAASTAAAGLRSTVQGLSEVTAAARAAAALGSRPGSACGRASGGARPAAAAADIASGQDQPPEFVLQFIAAVVRAQRSRIMAECREHDDVLRLFNSLQIEFWQAVAQARKQHKAYVGPAGSLGR